MNSLGPRVQFFLPNLRYLHKIWIHHLIKVSLQDEVSNFLDFIGCTVDLQWLQQRYIIYKQTSQAMPDGCSSKPLASYMQDLRNT